MKTKFNTRSLVLLGLLTAIVMVFSFTPIGSFPIGPLVITLNVIPIAIAAAAVGPIGGLIIGAVFGLFSFLQCFGIGVLSGMGAIQLEVSPILTFIQRFVPRALDGLLAGLIFRGVSKLINVQSAGFITGFFTAFLNTLLFMSALVLFFGNAEAIQEKYIKGQSFIPFVIGFVGINAVVEMAVCTVITGAVCAALYAGGFIQNREKKPAKAG